MSEELNDKDPFDEPEEQDKKYLISEAMVKKATFLIHKLANRKKQDYKEIQNKCKKLFSYTNLAKVSMDEGHQIINKLIELTGGEEEKPQLPAKPDDGFKATVKDNLIHEKIAQKTKEIKKESTERSETKELETELGKLAEMLQICVGFSRDIVEEEIGKENVTEGTQAMLVKSFAATLFIEASRRGLGR
jgi:hypothetical protein